MENSSSDSSTSTEAVVETPAEGQPIVPPVESGPKMSKKLKLKLDGQEVDEELPFEYDENNKAQVDYLKRNLQMSKAASKRMNEASTTRKQAEQFIQALQTDPMSVLSNPKIMGNEKFQEIAEAFLAKKLQDQMLSPAEKKQIEMEQKLRGYEEQEKAAKAAKEQEQAQQLEAHYAQQYEKTIMDALNSSSLPKNPFTVRRMADLMQKNLQHGLDLEPSQLAQLVREDFQKEIAGLIGGSDASQILALFGDDVANKIRKHDLASFKSKQPGFQASTNPQPAASKPPEQQKRMRPHEYEAYLKSKK